MGFSWIYEGGAWVFGDDIGVDGDLMPLKFALTRETDPEILRQHLFAGVDPEFPRKYRPGDIIVGGRRFAQGNPHIQGLLGLQGAGLALVAESIPNGSLRNCVNAGLPTLPACAGIRDQVQTGDRLRVDFSTGEVRNLSSGWSTTYEPLKQQLRDIIAIGGWREHFRRRLGRA
jgi:3-isopropylmalate/(R)-2-methylmalate dehydratase small subunit